MGELPNNSDFLNQVNPTSKQVELVKKKRRTALEIEMEAYPEYYALCEYDRKCLVANNYWSVMYGNPIIEVPPSDEHYHKYFDKKCYDRVAWFKNHKKLEAEYNKMIKNHREQTDLKKLGQVISKEFEGELIDDKKITDEKDIKSNGDVVVENTTNKVEIEIKKQEEMPLEENKNFLNEKREHPVYPKREKIEYKKEPETETEVKNSKSNSNNKKSNNASNDGEQISLF